ncbi:MULTISPECIES: hypothetical protein [Flavobacterium]|uniref:hypothetical protein n=1 Tax=Flavobacterium TaxID=237 RepID=UPI000344B03A|nr:MULTISPECIES: hypothetical protein [Flavobacterium]MDL2142917.1 hypothetical protein [Flavobacterium tructae]URC12609.1 hypothetical protein M4I44_21375 [Flavobacterium sp. B183]
MNLENLNLVELNAQELISIEAGNRFWGWVGAEIVDHWDEIKKGFREGWAAASH